MTLFVELVGDAFEEQLERQTNRRTATGRASRSGTRVARRPTRGLEIKEDTPAAIKVILSNGDEVPLIDSSSADNLSSNGYTNFMLQSVQEARMEKHQIIETFGANYIFLFGESPRFLDVSAVIINSHDFNWEAEWWENYEENFRGTRCVEKGARLYLFYDESVVEGYMLMSQAVKSSTEPHLIQMSFRMFLTNYRNVSFVGSNQFPVHQSATIPDSMLYLNSPQTAINGDNATIASLLQQAGRTQPLRGLIASNLDEMVGLSENQIAQSAVVTSGTYTANPQSAITPAQREHLETDNLHSEAVTKLAEHGADIDNPQTFQNMGLQPFFSTNAKAGATFRPQEKPAFSFDAGTETTSDNQVNPTSRFRQDPLGAVYGDPTKNELATDNRFTEGVGDAEYGFHSEFSFGRPGFGEAGYGDFGGPGFGSAQGASGDPGFKDPAKFSFAGVTSNQAAFNKFRKPRPDQTAFGRGSGIASASAGLAGGAAVRINGKPSPFSLVSLPGKLKL